MGCLNSEGKFEHWFGNIHLSGPCNRSCYFCIGQHMMALDAQNNLDKWPLDGIDKFVNQCNEKGITEVNLTGTNTEPTLYGHIPALKRYLSEHMDLKTFGIRTNGVAYIDLLEHFDQISVSITTLDQKLYYQTMVGYPPDMRRLYEWHSDKDLRVNIVLCPEVVRSGQIHKDLGELVDIGYKSINLREPYGQPHIGDPLKDKAPFIGYRFDHEPMYDLFGANITYWDVHYCHVESVNLYANGHVSLDYPVTRGHDFDKGEVKDQGNFNESGRIRPQWLTKTKEG